MSGDVDTELLDLAEDVKHVIHQISKKLYDPQERKTTIAKKNNTQSL